ncbi:MAG: YicC family protein [Candidatus Omnitrophica bacterium]|nr:YicC family protein [Candidatus Omnitrophota bacterium]
MLTSMTGFGMKEQMIDGVGKVSVELRSANHKFLDVVFHLPPGFISLEERIKKAIEARIKRGRITCVININGEDAPRVFINKNLLKQYMQSLKNIKQEYKLVGDISLDTLLQLPGVIALAEHGLDKAGVWPKLNLLVDKALEQLDATRHKEGRALYRYLLKHASLLSRLSTAVETRFKKAVSMRTVAMKSDDEKINFIKDSDIAEEVARLSFHVKNFKQKITKGGVIGKELDFIAQEMQRESNTIAAKTFDTAVSAKIVQIKSQIEKIREQVQNVE